LLGRSPLASVEDALSVLRGALGVTDSAAAETRAGSLGLDSSDADRGRAKDVRSARALLDAAARRAGRTAVLRVHARGQWFELPSGRRVACGRRRALGAILLALVRRRLTNPDEVLTKEDLLAAGWPDERILPLVASNRLHVALMRLRKLGLGGIVETSDAGYRICSDVEVELVG
jgi:hypothetical protein